MEHLGTALNIGNIVYDYMNTIIYFPVPWRILGTWNLKARTSARTFLFSSESVNEGHPDKLCDQAKGGCLVV